MNVTNTTFKNIGNSNKTYHELNNEKLTGITSQISKSQLGAGADQIRSDQKEYTPIISKDSSLDTKNNDIHDRNIHSKGTESYLKEPGDSHLPFHKHIDNSTQHNSTNTKTTSDTNQWPSFSETVKGFCTSLVAPMKEHGFKSFHWNPQPKLMAASLFNLCFPSLSVMGTFALTVITLTRSVGASKSDSTTTSSLSDIASAQNIIGVNNLDTLMKIGNHADYPTNGNYRLTADIDASQLQSSIKIFTGSFNGDGYTIFNLPCCLINTLAGNSVVKNLSIDNANTKNAICSAALVGQANDNSKINDIQVKSCNIYSDFTHRHPIGVVAEILDGTSTIENSLVQNCTLTTHGSPSADGMIAGLMLSNSKSIGNSIVDCEIIAFGSHAKSGCIIGYATQNSQSIGNRVSHCNVNSHNVASASACVIGKIIENTQSLNDNVSYCNIITNGPYAHAGIVAGQFRINAEISNGTFRESTASAFGKNSFAAIGVATLYDAKLFDNTATNCIAIANGSNSRVGVWSADIKNRVIHNNNIAINCTPEWNATEILTTEAEIVDVPFQPIGLLIAGAVTSIGVVVCFSRSLCRAHQEGQTGLDLAKYPFKSFGKWLTNCLPSHYSYQRQQQDEEIFELDIIE